MQLFAWPAYSPDMSPIEHVCDLVGRCLARDLRPATSKDELLLRIQAIWNSLPQSDIQNLFDSMPRNLDTTQRKHLQNFSKPTETALCQGAGFFGDLRHFQKEESQLKVNLAAEGPQFQRPLKSPGSCAFRSSFDMNRFLVSKNIPDAPQPPYSTNLSPCDFFLFPKLKNHLKGRHFGTLENIQTAVTNQLKAIPISEFYQCYEEWKKRLQRYVASEGGYFEGDNVEL
ncbi:putative transposase [Trichonephila clavipes]|nr:putative transposase [Trichonephila clavipes]